MSQEKGSNLYLSSLISKLFGILMVGLSVLGIQSDLLEQANFDSKRFRTNNGTLFVTIN